MNRKIALGAFAIMLAVIATVGSLVAVGSSSDVTAKEPVALIADTSPDLPEVSAGDPAKIRMVGSVFANTSPDLPELHQDAKVVRVAEYIGTSPDLPGVDNNDPEKVRMAGDMFANTSPDLPEVGAEAPVKVANAGVVYENTSPDLPEFGQDAKVAQAEPEDNLPDDIFGGPSTRVNGGNFGGGDTSNTVATTRIPIPWDDAEAAIQFGFTDRSAGMDDLYGRIQREIAGAPTEEDRLTLERWLNSAGFIPLPWDDVEADIQLRHMNGEYEDTPRIASSLPLESFAYFSIDGVNPIAVVKAGARNDEVALPLESFAYFSIDGVNPIVDINAGNPDTVARILIPLPWDDAEADIQLDYMNREKEGLPIIAGIVPLPWDDAEAEIQLEFMESLGA